MDRIRIQSSAELLRELNFLGMMSGSIPVIRWLQVKEANTSNHGFVYKASQRSTRCCCVRVGEKVLAMEETMKRVPV